jgi:hypothetical protein
MGVSNAPPRLSSDPKVDAVGMLEGLPHDMFRGSTPEVPLERTLREEGSGTAGGRGNVCAPDVTCTTRSRAWRYDGKVR